MCLNPMEFKWKGLPLIVRYESSWKWKYSFSCLKIIYSEIHTSKRILQHDVVTCTINVLQISPYQKLEIRFDFNIFE